MTRINQVLEEVTAAREEATARFAAEVNMPIPDFRRHFRVVTELTSGAAPQLSFRVEPRE